MCLCAVSRCLVQSLDSRGCWTLVQVRQEVIQRAKQTLDPRGHTLQEAEHYLCRALVDISGFPEVLELDPGHTVIPIAFNNLAVATEDTLSGVVSFTMKYALSLPPLGVDRKSTRLNSRQ